jgi:hypothetical protein
MANTHYGTVSISVETAKLQEALRQLEQAFANDFVVAARAAAASIAGIGESVGGLRESIAEPSRRQAEIVSTRRAIDFSGTFR